MSKLSPRSLDILQKMHDGWELGVSGGIDSYAWIQKDGLGRGGETISLHGSTFNSLRDRGLIEQKKYQFPSSLWGLTEDGVETVSGKQ